MRIKYESRWRLEELKLEICSSIDELINKYGIEYATGINLYMNCEDKEFNLVDVINEDGKAGNFETVWTIHVKNTTGFSTGQDIYYDAKTDCLFLPFCDLANCNNKIMVVNLSGAYEMHKGNKLYTPQDTIVINKKGKYTRYEVESVAITENREMLMAVNLRKLGAGSDDDAVEKISNIKF